MISSSVSGFGSALAPTAVRTGCSSTAMRRPHRKAARFIFTPTPLSLTASAMAASEIGISPFCQAYPRVKKLAAIESPRSFVAMPVASMGSKCCTAAAIRKVRAEP